MPGSVIVGSARTPIGKLSGALAGFSAQQLGGLAIKAALERAGVGAEQVDYVLMGQVLQAGQGRSRRARRRSNGWHPDDGARNDDQQGVPLGHQRDLPRRPDDPERRRRSRHRRRHGVDDERAVPPPRRACRLPHGQQRGRRLDDQRRVVVRVRRRAHGQRHRELRRPGRRHHPRGAGRAGREVARAGRGRPEGRPLRRRAHAGFDSAAQGRPDRRRHRRRRAARNLGGIARRIAPRVLEGRHDHRRQRLADLRRRAPRSS